MSVDGNFVVLIHKQLLCLVLRRGRLGWVLDDDSRGDEMQRRWVARHC